MIKDTQNKKSRAYRAFVGLVFLSFLIFGLFMGFSVKTAQGANNYVDNTKFYKNDLDLYTLEFHVKSSFTWGNLFWCYNSNCSGLVGKADFDINKDFFGTPQASLFYNIIPSCYTLPVWSPNSGYYIDTWHCDLVAGNTYKMNVNNFMVWDITKAPANAKYLYQYNLVADDILTLMSGRLYPAGDNNEQVVFSEFPSLTITYPPNNAEIAGEFNIQGSYTLPANTSYDKLSASFGERGESGSFINWYNFYQDVESGAGAVNMIISGLPAGDYTLGFAFFNSQEPQIDRYIILDLIDIKLLFSMSPVMGGGGGESWGGEIYEAFDAMIYYTGFSSYATATQFYINITGTIQPIMSTIGDNLAFFASKFNQGIARQTGESIGGSVLIMRSYIGTLNEFFNDLPISQALFLYLMVLVLVVIFRLVRLLIKLIPFI